MDSVTPQPVCSKESLDLLNCIADPQFDRDKCLHFMDALRACIVQKKVKKFSLAEQGRAAEASDGKGKSWDSSIA